MCGIQVQKGTHAEVTGLLFAGWFTLCVGYTSVDKVYRQLLAHGFQHQSRLGLPDRHLFIFGFDTCA